MRSYCAEMLADAESRGDRLIARPAQCWLKEGEVVARIRIYGKGGW